MILPCHRKPALCRPNDALDTRTVKSMSEENRVVPLPADLTDGSPEINDMLVTR